MYFKSKINRIIELTPERKNHIIEYHPDVVEYFSKISAVLKNPDQMRKSRILTYYLTNKIRTGRKIYE